MSEKYSADYIRNSVKQMVSEIAEIPIARVTDTASFMEEFGMDSLRAMELMVAVDRKYKIRIPEAEFVAIGNVNQAVETVQRYLPAA